MHTKILYPLTAILIIVLLLILIGISNPKKYFASPDHVTSADIVEANRICTNHEGLSIVAMFSSGLTIYCNDGLKISDYEYNKYNNNNNGE